MRNDGEAPRYSPQLARRGGANPSEWRTGSKELGAWSKE
jgi:hypothetical protein